MPRRQHRQPPSESRKFGSIRVLPDGRVCFSAWIFPGLPHLDFVAQHRRVGLDDSDVYDLANYSICAQLRAQPIFFLHLTRRRVESAGFAYTLTPAALEEAVSVLRAAGAGLESWITPGLAHMQAALAEMKPDAHRRALLAAIPGLLRSVRDIPTAKPWEPLRREWEQWRREQARKAAAPQTPSKPAPGKPASGKHGPGRPRR
ncbi:MAG TPA: hypothetical protein VK447_08115 [Myxococcaceae bacterium]|nr:hypothetical protein [Myxococcaceae bacterium]